MANPSSSNNLKNIVAAIPCAACIIKAGIIIAVNDAFSKIFDENVPENLSGKTPEALVPNLPESIKLYLKQTSTKKYIKKQWKSWHIGGKSGLLAAESVFIPLKSYILWIIKDSTQEEIMSNLPLVIYASHPKKPRSIRYISAPIETFSGYSPEIFYHHSKLLDSLIHPEDQERVNKAIKQAINNLEGWDISYRLVPKAIGSSYIWVRDQAFLVMHQNKPISLIGTIKDITKLKNMEIALAEAKLRHRLLFEKAPVGILYIDKLGYIIDCNDQLAKIFKTDKNKVIGYNSLQANNMLLRTIAKKALRGKEHYFEGLYQSETSGEEAYISLIATPLKDNEENIIGCLCLVQDITEQQHMEEQLRQAQKMEAIHRLAGGVAHQLNNQLTAITGYIHLLLQQFEDDKRKKFLEAILRAANKAADTTNQLLISSQKEDMSCKELDINECIQKQIKYIQKNLPSNIQIKTDLDRELPLIKANPFRIHQLLENVLQNAKDSMKETGGDISISTKVYIKDANDTNNNNPVCKVRLTISDTGIGMEPYVLERAFEPFFTTKPVGEGQGLGLSTVYGIVRQYGGDIKLKSQKNKGTTVIINFPAILY